MDTELLKLSEVSRTRHFGRAALPDAIRGELSYQATGESTGRKPFTRHRNNIRLTTAGENFTVCGNADEYVAGGT